MPLDFDGHAYIIAEIGANHNGDMALARRHVRAAREAGANAAKFQSWGKGLFSSSVYAANPGLEAQVEGYAVAPDELAGLAAYCRAEGIDFASTPFSPEEVRQLDVLEPPFVKIASMDLDNDRMLRAVAETGRTIVLSTGFATMAEIEHALRTLEDCGHTDTVLLHCVALYPPPDDSYVNLRNMETLARTFGYPVGFSDHTTGVEIPIAAIALGAAVVEKHFTLDKTMDGWDHAVSADPGDLAVIAAAARRVPAALGRFERTVSAAEQAQAQAMRRSAVAARDLPAGHVVGEADIEFRRPGTGIAPNDAARLVGRVTTRAVGADELFDESHFEARRGRSLALGHAA